MSLPVANFPDTVRIVDHSNSFDDPSLVEPADQCTCRSDSVGVELNPLWANAMHYADLCKQWQSASGWGDKMRKVWGSPSTHAADSLPFRPSAFVRYAPKTPRILAVYATLQYALLVPIFMGFLFIFEKTPLWTSVLYGLWLSLSVLCISGLLENKAWARWCEALRWLAAGLALAQL